MKRLTGATVLLSAIVFTTAARADVIIEYGNENLLNTGTYPSDPKAGATLSGLAPGVVTDATNSFAHSYPFSPSAGDFPGTDQIYVGSHQTASHDGYSASSERVAGPQERRLRPAVYRDDQRRGEHRVDQRAELVE
jgi:hypothetical protein